MAKSFNSSLPKVISKANRDISTIIESDIASESRILKNLVDQVLKANLEVKKKNNARITETKRRITELDSEIANLNITIDDVDRDTVIRQLNEMIHTENNIFNAKQEIRFFDNEKAQEKIDSFNELEKELTESLSDLYSFEDDYHTTLLSGNALLFNKQIEITNEIIGLMKDMFDNKQVIINEKLLEFKVIEDNITSLELDFQSEITATISKYTEIRNANIGTFSAEDDDEFISDKIEKDHNDTIDRINENITSTTETYNDAIKLLKDEFALFEENTRLKLENRDKQALDKEKQKEKEKEEQLKNIRLLIMDAEKKNNFGKVTKLLKQFDKIEKTKAGKQTQQVTKEFDQITKKPRIKYINQLKSTELKYYTDLNHLNHALALENIKYEESKILYKIKNDKDGLQQALSQTDEQLKTIKNLLNTKLDLGNKIIELKQELRINELQLMKDNELLELDLIASYKEFISDLKGVEHNRLISLLEDLNKYDEIRFEQEFLVDKSILEIKLNQELSNIDKLIVKKRNETTIINEKIKEEANSDIIFQESLIRIAEKENELQMIKVKSLYENERSLAEDQYNRINLGIQVNDAFIKTTLENQLLFATQQIKCAESEYEIRVESINLTRSQELDYSTKKIDRFKHKYEYEKGKLQKELDDKLEDLNYKLLLFTDEKDNLEIQNKINVLKNTYNKMISEIDEVENADKGIIRYQKVIDDANNRAEEAINEALLLKEQTINSFSILYEQTKMKYDSIIETDVTEETRGIMPVLNNSAISSADDRLQKALREADELYEEKVIDPKKIIEERKAFLEETISNTETDEYIQSQKERKRALMDEHKVNIDKLLEEKQEKMLDLGDTLYKAKLIQEKELEQSREDLFKDAKYRNEQDINSDYDALFDKERKLHEAYKQDLNNKIKKMISSYPSLLKEENNKIKKVLKPYKKYIRFASRGLTAKKKDLAKKFNKLLKKELNEINQNYNRQISNI